MRTPRQPAAADPAAPLPIARRRQTSGSKKLDKQKEKIDSLNHELDLDQRELRLRAAAYYGDAGTRLRDSAQFDKDEAQYKSRYRRQAESG